MTGDCIMSYISSDIPFVQIARVSDQAPKTQTTTLAIKRVSNVKPAADPASEKEAILCLVIR